MLGICLLKLDWKYDFNMDEGKQRRLKNNSDTFSKNYEEDVEVVQFKREIKRKRVRFRQPKKERNI